MPYLHFDEAKRGIRSAVLPFLAGTGIGRILFIVDFSGRIRVVLWGPGTDRDSDISAALAAACGDWWTGQILRIADLDSVNSKLYNDAWELAPREAETDHLRVLDRHRNRTAWFRKSNPPWRAPSEGPAIIVFYSFKGGLGRSTLLASFAIQQAQAGARVCVIDFDLDSPGLGTILSADSEGRTARWGVVDFLLENPGPQVPLDDYYHRCDRVSGAGQIIVFPAGSLDDMYADKLSRVDFEVDSGSGPGKIESLLSRIRDDLSPSWILIDARTGISEQAGHLLSGCAHAHVLLGTNQEQSWQGLSRVLDRLGRERLIDGQPQGDTILVQAMVPNGEAGRIARELFLGRAETEYENCYYSAVEEEEAWDISDKGLEDAPHIPVTFEYEPRLASYKDITEVEEALAGPDYSAFSHRVTNRFIPETEE